ncbi:CinA-like protein [Collibacillus ludicampi]|jgi:nicotinamide-nucleotide amidase|uniref:Putative competence-damage inducible protein n=1 Tax=Collibacillus ludicampi TaxID=2771369 RepID=A0AAV4LKI2_9BACL|nr:competence/damage-inducible protein A [Collibacillus ludicampi]GIM47877.1 CinA-like protein [Collibacillus ludicampi]
MKAEIIAVGTELLMGQIANTNAQYISARLPLEGIGVYYHQVIGDNRARLREALQLASSRSSLVILTGGLGPTEDDLTREAVADFLGKPLILDPEVLAELEAFFTQRGRTMSENNRKQAMVIEGAMILKNPRGTAPGMYIEQNGTHFFLLPGPPTEMRPMYEEQVVPLIRSLHGQKKTIRSRILRMAGIGESMMEMKIADLIRKQSNPTIAPYASEGEVSLRITAQAETEDQAYRLIAPVEQELRNRLGTYIYGIDDETLPVAVGKLLRERKETVSVAESCTGGLLGAAITDIPGSSDYFTAGYLTYSNRAKREILYVSEDILNNYGAVSSECAKAMAEGCRKRSQSDWAIAITGIAGPGGGTPEKPVGLVYIAVSHKNETVVHEHHFRGDRAQIRMRSVKAALHAILQCMKTER